MSESAAPQTMVQMRTLRRFSHYNAGELIAVPWGAARDLEYKGLAQALSLLVPVLADAAGASDGETSSASAPLRQPTATVRK